MFIIDRKILNFPPNVIHTLFLIPRTPRTPYPPASYIVSTRLHHTTSTAAMTFNPYYSLGAPSSTSCSSNELIGVAQDLDDIQSSLASITSAEGLRYHNHHQGAQQQYQQHQYQQHRTGQGADYGFTDHRRYIDYIDDKLPTTTATTTGIAGIAASTSVSTSTSASSCLSSPPATSLLDTPLTTGFGVQQPRALSYEPLPPATTAAYLRASTIATTTATARTDSLEDISVLVADILARKRGGDSGGFERRAIDTCPSTPLSTTASSSGTSITTMSEGTTTAATAEEGIEHTSHVYSASPLKPESR